MPIPRNPVSWPLTGGLDTHKSPLAIQPGSHLTLDNVIQERVNEWRRRNGFTQSALDNGGSTTPYFVGALGDAGMLQVNGAGLEAYSPSATPRWNFPIAYTPAQPQHRTRKPIVANDLSGGIGFARAGNVIAVGAASNTAGPAVTSYDVASGAPIASTVTAAGTAIFRGAATATKLAMFTLSATTLFSFVIDAATGAITAGATVVTAFTKLDATWYGGATITVVAATAAGAVTFLEFNPATAAFTVNVGLGGILADSALALLADPTASGVRYVATSGTTPTTRVVRCSSAGAILTNDQAEAVASTQIAGIGTDAGNPADWSIIYQTTAPNLRTNKKVNNVIAGAAAFMGSATWGTSGTLDSQAWSEPQIGSTSYFVLIGLHSQTTSDPQDTWVEYYMPGANTPNAPVPISSPVALAAAPKLSTPGTLYQVVRTAPQHFSSLLPVQVVYENNSGTVVRHFSLDLFEQTFMNEAGAADTAITATQRPLKYKQTSYIPNGLLSYYDAGTIKHLGTLTPPRILTGVSSVGAGALTPAAQYFYKAIVETIDSDGNLWRSPETPALALTLGVADNTVTITYASWAVEPDVVRVGIYRTDANGSSYRRITSFLAAPGANVVYVDLIADSVADQGEVLYTIGELQTAITPPLLAVWMHDDRLFGINREYTTEVWYTKNLRPGRQPEFTNEGIVDQDDEFGGCTNGAHLDDKAVLFKKNAIYFSQNHGFTDSGSGTNYEFTQISGDVGAIAGSPVVSNGQTVWFVSERGIYTVDKQGNVVFDGEGIDQYLNQPLIQARETVYDGVFVSLTNEVVFVTTNYLLVRNLTFNTWTRWTGLAGMRRCLVVNGQLVLFRNDGTVWRQGDQTQLTDQGTAFTGVIRSPWMRPSNGLTGPGTASTSTTSQQGLRIYEGRVVYTRTAGGGNVSLIGRIYRNNDDAQVETFTSDGIDGSVLSGTGVMKPRDQKCTAFSVELVLPSGDVTVRVDGFAAVVGVRDGSVAADSGQRWP